MDERTIRSYAKLYRPESESVDLSTPNIVHATGFMHRRWENAKRAHKYVFEWNDYSVSFNFTKQWWETFYQPQGVEREFISGEHKHIFDAFDAAYDHKAAKNKQLLKNSQVQ